ncbi:MAG: hypothetical protein WDN25_30765 [Acetobacteraceae bacterium]
MSRRILPALLAACLLANAAGGALAAEPPAETSHPPLETLAPVAGAVAGFGVYSLLIGPELTVAEGAAAVLGARVAAAALAGAGAVAGTFAYDTWTGQPLDYAYLWHRSGFIAGLAAGIAAFGVLGYPIDGGVTWIGWTANRAALLGAGLAGAWATDQWYQAP